MKELDILHMIGEAREDLVLDARQLLQPQPGRKSLSLKKLWLAAALILLAMALMGCTVAYAYSQGWFEGFYSARNDAPLSGSQLQYLSENEQILNQSQTQEGWTIELRSAITDGTTGMVILGITAPEDTSLDFVYNENGIDISRLHITGSQLLPLQYPEGVSGGVLSGMWLEDTDGLANTRQYVLSVQPDPSESIPTPFAADTQWNVKIDSICRITDNVELLKEIANGQGEYATFEEVSKEEILTEGLWDFTFSFRFQKPEEANREFLSAPVVTTAMVYRPYGDGDGEYAYLLEDITVTSFQLNPLTATICYEFSGLHPFFYWEEHQICAVMRDGREILLGSYGSRREGSCVLNAQAPIVVEEVDHIRLADGTKLYPSGKVKPAPHRKADPVSAPEFIQPGKTTLAKAASYYAAQNDAPVYGYLADFDGDTVEDLALWQEGVIRTLCLLDAKGRVTEEVTLEEGVIPYEKYNMWAPASEQIPDLLMVGEDWHNHHQEECFRLLHLRNGILTLHQGFRMEDGQYWLLHPQEGPYDANNEVWQEVTEENYHALRKNYNSLRPTLTPIEWFARH